MSPPNAMETSPLWQRIYAQSKDPDVDRLVTSLRVARSRVADLTSRIASSLPTLTIHDLSHLDALWTVGGTIAGDHFDLNPLETYVFGSAALLHDSALCFEAYSGGQQAVRDTVQWRDAYSRRCADGGQPDLDAVDFEALRGLHATRAASLATEPWYTDQGPQYIIDDADLRTQYGPLIGKIASSHHWNIDQIAERFAAPRPSASFLRHNWSVNPLKIACLLRAADAGHIDSSRAPTFLLKILEMNSISRAHWVAQNHLGQLAVKHDDPTQLVVASTAPFREEEASAWWVAFDLVTQLDKELTRCDEILASVSVDKQTFARKRVAAAGNVSELSKTFIQTDGWQPTNSSVHVSDVTALVDTLGGERLYGSHANPLAIALRELVQNAADAIAARRLIGGQPTFEGHISVRLFVRSDCHHVLQVDDDGVGMSATTLCEDLLDFGKSFWASERASREFPGIHAGGHSPRGRFGIGFFSIFMAANSAHVYSRRFDKGLADVRCLSFDKGLSLRPTLTKRRPQDLGMDVSTRVELVLKSDAVADPNRIKVSSGIAGQPEEFIRFTKYVTALVSGIDVNISIEMDGVPPYVHKRFPPQPGDRAQWLRDLSYISAGVNQRAAAVVEEASLRLREMRDGNTCYGLAAISILHAHECSFLAANAVGGFAPFRDSSGSFIGTIDHLPKSAAREPGDMAAPRSIVEAWLSEQVELLNGHLSPPESIRLSYSLCRFDYDSIDVLQGIVVISAAGYVYWSLKDLSGILRAGHKLGFRVSKLATSHLEQYDQRPIDGFSVCAVLGTGEFNRAEVSTGGPTHPKSLIGVVHRVLVAQGTNPTWIRHPSVYRSILGECDCLEVRI